MDLTVIIVNYNVKHLLAQCLQSVFRASERLQVEVIVVDNNSRDGSQAMVRERFGDRVILIENADNPGFSKANNQGIAIARGKYVLLLNPDTIVEEDTFDTCFTFMEEHPDGGGLGVRMVDGTGTFLPESKRGLPTPWVAFYKIFGLSRFFPGSKTFGKYHLSYLNEHDTHEVDVLSGAFMWMRKRVLDEIGGLDETFFMYGEDIDLSYRIQLAGYKNYYLPEARILHYKGESTKKGSLNYVKVFYQAMIIFADKHFQGGTNFFSLLIRFAVVARALLAVFRRVGQRLALPLLEGGLIYCLMFGVKEYWEHYVKFIEGGAEYPDLFSFGYMPVYALVFVLSFWLAGAYRKPFRIKPLIIAPFAAFIFIATATYVFPFILNFSRAIVGLSAVFASLLGFGLRGVINWREKGSFFFTEPRRQRSVVLGDREDFDRISQLANHTGYQREILGFVGEGTDALGTPGQLLTVLRAYQAEEVIIPDTHTPARGFLDVLEALAPRGFRIKSAPAGWDVLIGPQEIVSEERAETDSGLAQAYSRRQKRSFDLLASGLLLLGFPILGWFMRTPGKAWKGLWAVLRGKRTLVSSGKNGLLNIGLLGQGNLAEKPLNRYYHRYYSWLMDADILWNNWRNLGL